METQSLEFKGLKKRPASTYVSGNAVRKTAPAKQPEKKLKLVPGRSGNRNLLYGMVLTIFYSACVCLFIGSILVYISLQSGLSNSVEEISSLQMQYENAKKANDEELTAINNSIDNEEIRRIAIEELGMHYATDGQIVSYSDNYSNDYVRVYSVIH